MTDSGTTAPNGTYNVKLLYNNVRDTWLGVLGNTSSAFTGPDIYAGAGNMRGMAFHGSGGTYTAFTANGYQEGGPLSYTFNSTTGPQSPMQIPALQPHGGNMTISETATDGSLVYYMNVGGGAPDTFVFAIGASNQQLYTFSGGYSFKDSQNTTYSTLAFDNGTPTGMAVEQGGSILAISQGSSNSVSLFNKTTGASLGTLKDAAHLASPGRIAFAPAASGKKTSDLWIISGASVLRYVNTGTDAAPNYIYGGHIGGFALPLDVAINPTNNTSGEIVVADGGASQQIKAYTFAGASRWTYGQAGGYDPGGVGSPAVTNNKLYLDPNSGGYAWGGSGGQSRAGGISGVYPDPQTGYTFLAFQPDGRSLWVADRANARFLQLKDAGKSVAYNAQISYLPDFYSVAADPVASANGTLRVFADWLEYDYNPNLTLHPGDPNAKGGDGSWVLAKNWNTAIPTALQHANPMQVTTLGNGRTYAVLLDDTVRNNSYFDQVVELPASGGVRVCSTSAEFPQAVTGFEANGDLRAVSVAYDSTLKRFTQTVTEQALSGFDSSNDPTWNSTVTTLASVPVGPDDPTYGTPGGYNLDNNLPLTSGNVLVSYNGSGGDSAAADSTGAVMHLGGISTQGGQNSAWQWQTMPSGFLHVGDTQGTFEAIDGYGGAAGIGAWASGHNILTYYNGQYNSYSNLYTHYWDDGLFVSEFGVNDVFGLGTGTNAPAGMSANAPAIMVAAGGNVYMFAADESIHSGVAVWRVSGLDTIHEMSASGALGANITLSDPNGPAVDWHADAAGGLTLADSSGNNNSGTLVGSGVSFSNSTDTFSTLAASAGDSLAFASGAKSFADVPSAASINFAGAITLDAWVRATADTGTHDILTHGSLAGKSQVFLRINNGRYEAGIDNAGTITRVSVSALAGDAGNWVRLTATYDGASWKLYDDGALLGSMASKAGAITTSSHWYIGGNPSDSSWYFQGGSIDEAAIYPRALTANEISALANCGAFRGTVHNINSGALAAANYDNGGDGAGYHSVTFGNYLVNERHRQPPQR